MSATRLDPTYQEAHPLQELFFANDPPLRTPSLKHFNLVKFLNSEPQSSILSRASPCGSSKLREEESELIARRNSQFYGEYKETEEISECFGSWSNSTPSNQAKISHELYQSESYGGLMCESTQVSAISVMRTTRNENVRPESFHINLSR
jgi:hypothetical protein